MPLLPRDLTSAASRALGPRPSSLGARRRAAAVFGTGAAAGAAFGGVALASARRATVASDNRIHDEMREKLDGAAGAAAEAVAPAVEQAGKWWVYGPAALAAAVAVLAAPGGTARTRRGRRIGAAAITVVPVLASTLSPAFDRWFPQPPVGPRRRPLDHPVFPSGHAFRASAVALAAAYVVTREEIASPNVVWSLAGIATAAVGVGRLVREKHLASDVVGGWLAGAALAAAAAGAYELTRAPRPSRRWRLAR